MYVDRYASFTSISSNHTNSKPRVLIPISLQAVLPTVTSGEWKMTKAEGARVFNRGPESGWTCAPLKIKGLGT